MASQAEIEIRDSKNRLSALPGFRTSFSQAFICDQPQSFNMRTERCDVSCTMGICKEICKGADNFVETLLSAEDCRADELHIYSGVGGHDIRVTQKDYESSHQTLVRSLIPALNFFYDTFEMVEILDFMYPVPRVLIENGKKRNFFVAVISLDAYPRKDDFSKMAMSIEIEITADGLKQFHCLSAEPDCFARKNSYLFKRKGYFNAQ